LVLIDFWTYSCINCVRTLPYITDWDRKYATRAGDPSACISAGIRVREETRTTSKAAIAQHGIRYPVALETTSPPG